MCSMWQDDNRLKVRMKFVTCVDFSVFYNIVVLCTSNSFLYLLSIKHVLICTFKGKEPKVN